MRAPGRDDMEHPYMSEQSSKQLIDSLVSAISREIVTSAVLAQAVSRQIVDNPTLLQAVIDSLDAETVARQLASSIIYHADKNSLTARGTYSAIMRDAKARAIELVAERIAAETLTA